MTTARLCALVVLLWTPGDAFEATSRAPTTTYTCPTASLETMEPPLLYYAWAAILSCVLLLSAGILSTSICLLNIYLWGTRLVSGPASQEEWIPMEAVEPLAQSLETVELLDSPPSPDVRPRQGEIQEPPPSRIVLVHRAQEDSSEEEAAPGALVHRNVTRKSLQPDSDQGEQ